MAYNGKHNLKNHPKTKIKPVPIVLATLSLVGVLKVNALLRKDDDIDLSPSQRIDSTITTYTLDNVLNNLKSKYFLSDEYGLTFEGLLFEFFESKVTDLTSLEELLSSKDLEEQISSYILTKSPLPIRMYKDSNNEEIISNLSIITSNTELMALINKLSLTYGIDEGLIIASIAHNITNGIIDTKNPMGIGDMWFNLDSKYTIYNYSLDEPETIVPLERNRSYSLEKALRYNIIITQSSIKQASGDSIEAISYLKYGPNLIHINQNEKDKLLTITNEILTYLNYYHKRNSYNLTTYYTLNKDNKSKKVERVQSQEYTEHLYNEIITSLTNYYKNNLFQKESTLS